VSCNISKKQVEINKTKVTIPEYVVGMFSVATALRSKPENLFLVGYDGYSEQAKNGGMNKFWKQLGEESQILSLLPTAYDIPVKSIYEFL